MDVTAAPGYGQAEIRWSPVTGATSYNIYYSTTSPVSKDMGVKVSGVTSPGIVTGLTIGTRHFFVVTAENADAESGISSEVSTIISAEYIAIGDSITFGSNDDIPSDGIGYEPILANLLTTTIANEGWAASPPRTARPSYPPRCRNTHRQKISRFVRVE